MIRHVVERIPGELGLLLLFVITLCELSRESDLPAKGTTVRSRWESLEEKIFLGCPGGREICIDARPYL